MTSGLYLKKSELIRASAFLLVSSLLYALILSPGVQAVQPFGANISNILSNQTAPIPPPESFPAVAGNVTELNLNGYSTTQFWQGYYGNVSGSIILSNGANNIFYNWSDASPKGEVFASTNNSINWYNLQCFNFTATGAINSTGEVPGGTNQKGMNLSQLEGNFSIPSSAPDSVNNTFDLLPPGNHTTFYASNLEFNGSECQSTNIFSASGTGVAGQFQEVLQYDPSTNSVVFTSILNQNALGFDNQSLDFEMLVLDDGAGTNTVPTPYYFYVELQ